jgi:4-carboxymuconolactone decarboxylase
MAAIAVAKDIFLQRGIRIDQLPPAKGKLLPLNEETEKQRATQVAGNFGTVAPGLVQATTDVLFRDLWLRPALAPRDRSLVTVSALIANGQTAQIPFHLNRAMDNGLTQSEASEVMHHIAFYAGWPCAMSALPVAREVFEKRQKSKDDSAQRHSEQSSKKFGGDTMKITRAGTIPSMVGPKDWFTGNVRVDSLFPADGGRHSNGGVVTFEPGARTRWHTHPAGQTIVITQGLGWVQKDGEAIQEVRPGDVVFFEPSEKHWHGASAQVGMTHIAITETVDGKAVDWLEAVSEEQYAR